MRKIKTGSVKGFFTMIGWLGVSVSVMVKFGISAGCIALFGIMLFMGLFGPSEIEE